AGGFGGPDVALGQIPAGAAVLLRPRRRHTALAVEDAVPDDVVLVVEEDARAAALRLAQLVGELAVEETPYFVPERFVLGAESDFQDPISISAFSSSNTCGSCASMARRVSASSSR